MRRYFIPPDVYCIRWLPANTNPPPKDGLKHPRIRKGSKNQFTNKYVFTKDDKILYPPWCLLYQSKKAPNVNSLKKMVDQKWQDIVSPLVFAVSIRKGSKREFTKKMVHQKWQDIVSPPGVCCIRWPAACHYHSSALFTWLPIHRCIPLLCTVMQKRRRKRNYSQRKKDVSGCAYAPTYDSRCVVACVALNCVDKDVPVH